jgi:hypothetical protein
MPKQELRDMREYYINTQVLDVGNAGTWFFGIPNAGYLSRAFFMSTVAQSSADATLTFAVGSDDLAQTMVIPSASGAIGRSHVVDFSRNAASYAYEAEDLDLVAARAVIKVVTDAGGTGQGRLVLVIRP